MIPTVVGGESDCGGGGGSTTELRDDVVGHAAALDNKPCSCSRVTTQTDVLIAQATPRRNAKPEHQHECFNVPREIIQTRT